MWRSKSERQAIILGIAPTPEDIGRALLFEDGTFRYSDSVAYRFIHEITHKMTAKLGKTHKPLIDLYDTFVRLREEHPFQGLSVIGSQSNSLAQGAEVQANEDIIELFTMYSWNPAYMKRFLQFCATTPQDRLKELGLSKLSSSTALNLFNIVHSTVDEFL